MSITIAVHKDLGADRTIFVEDHRAWPRDSFPIRIQEFESLNRRTVRIRQQRESNLLPVGELDQNVNRVVTDSDDLNLLFCERWEIFLQLDQLRTTVGSPAC